VAGRHPGSMPITVARSDLRHDRKSIVLGQLAGVANHFDAKYVKRRLCRPSRILGIGLRSRPGSVWGRVGTAEGGRGSLPAIAPAKSAAAPVEPFIGVERCPNVHKKKPLLDRTHHQRYMTPLNGER
jgi:hypothetical protein